MRSTSVVFSFFLFLLTTAHAASFQPLAIKLLSDSEESIKAKSELAKITNLDEQLKAAIQAGGREQMLAFRVMGSLERVKLVPWLIEKTREKENTSEEATLFVTALTSLCESTEGENILKFLNQYIDIGSKKIPTLTRLSVLTAFELRNSSPSIKIVANLLEDEDSLIRQKSMELLENNYQGDKSALVPVLKKALTLSPFPLRMRAAHLASSLSTQDRQALKSELLTCSQDARPEVQTACKTALSIK